MLSTVPSETTGEECPAHCPANCQQEEQICPGGIDFNGKSSVVIYIHFMAWYDMIHLSGCPQPESCMPMMNGECNVHCPAACHPEDIICSSGFDGNGEIGIRMILITEVLLS